MAEVEDAVEAAFRSVFSDIRQPNLQTPPLASQN
jgi:hypothetical protein